MEFEEPARDLVGEMACDSDADIVHESRGLSEEVADLFTLLDKHTKDVEEAHRDPEEERSSRFSFYSLLVACSITGIIYLIAKFTPISFWMSFKNPMVIIQGMFLLLYVVAAVYFFVEYKSMKHYSGFLRNPTRDLLKGLGKTIHEEIRLFGYLDSYSVEAISYASERLKYNHERVSALKSYFVGAIEKVGLLPGFIATIAAFVGSLYGKNWYAVYALSIGIGAMIGFYIAIVPAVFGSLRMKQYGFILEQYLRIKGKGDTGSVA